MLTVLLYEEKTLNGLKTSNFGEIIQITNQRELRKVQEHPQEREHRKHHFATRCREHLPKNRRRTKEIPLIFGKHHLSDRNKCITYIRVHLRPFGTEAQLTCISEERGPNGTTGKRSKFVENGHGLARLIRKTTQNESLSAQTSR